MLRVNYGRYFLYGWCLILLAAGPLVAGCGRTTDQSPPLTVKTMTVGPGANSNGTVYSGQVCGRYEDKLAFRVGGKVRRRLVDVGAQVQPGAVLMELDREDLELGAARVNAQLAAARSDLELARMNATRYQALYREGAVSQATLDQYENAYQTAREQVRNAEAYWGQSANQVSYATLSADQPGVVTSIAAEAGQVVAAGQTVITVVQTDELEIETYVPEQRIADLTGAADLTIGFWAFPDLKIAGRVREVSPQADPVTRTYRVRVGMPNPPAVIKLGMTATVSLGSPATTNLVIPLTAVYQTADQPSVWVIEDNVVHKRDIQVGTYGDNTVEVVGGLAAGEVIVTAGVQKLSEGQPVRIWEEDSR